MRLNEEIIHLLKLNSIANLAIDFIFAKILPKNNLTFYNL